MKRIFNYKSPINMLVLVNVIGFLLLYFYKVPFDRHILFAGLTVIVLILASYILLFRKSLGDEYLLLIVSMLVSLGVIMLYRLDRDIGIKQIGWLIIGMVLFFASYYLYAKVKNWDRLIYFYIGTSVVLFLLTLLLGKNIKGAVNWIVIGGHTFQPSELIKLLFVFTLAAYYRHPEKIKTITIKLSKKKINIPREIALMGIAYIFMGFLVLQQDWGSALLFFLIYFTLLYMSESNLKMLFLNASIAIIGGLSGYLLVYHIKVRVETWLNPWADIAGKGYQITQSLFAIGSGGFFGTGIGLGSPEFIPEVHTDFIFSAICEEMGIFGGVAVVLLLFILTYRGFKIALSVKAPFHKTVALGITLIFGFQTFIIIGGVIKLIPLTGITLPFVSYGGSSLTTSFIALGILQAISNFHADADTEEDPTYAGE